jgi:peptidyl-prolyl cis-trans isomerase A (cyclophilin A)
MIVRLLLAVLVSAVIACPATAQKRPGIVRVRLDTTAGPITLALDTGRAPATTANFLAYVDDKRFDGTSFYRAARARNAPTTGFIQAGIRTDARRILPPFPHEPTSRTGIRHLDATISMARRMEPDSAGGNYIITIGPAPQLDAKPGYIGYAAFGRVAAGMPLVRRILAQPTGGAMGGQMLLKPITIRRAVRLDGTPRPTGRPKAWLIEKDWPSR